MPTNGHDVPLYSIGTWDASLQAFTPHGGVPAFNLTAGQLRASMRMLRQAGYSVHRHRDVDGSHQCNDPSVLIERTDGQPESVILKGWG